MLLGPARDRRRRGERRRRAEAGAGAGAAAVFPLTVDGFDDGWPDTAALDGLVAPWYLDVAEEDPATASAVPAGGVAGGGRHERVTVLDRYSTEFDVPSVVPGGRADQEVGGGAAKMAAMPDEPPPDLARPAGPSSEPAAPDEGPGRAGGARGTDDVVAGVEGDGKTDDRWAAVADQPAPGAEVADGGAATGASGEAAGRRYLFVEAATRYATDDETSDTGVEPGAGEPAPYADDDLTEVHVPPAAAVPPPAPRSGFGRRRAVLAGVPLVLSAVAVAVWAATSSSGPDASRAAGRAATRTAVPETTAAAVPPASGRTIETPPVTEAPPTTVPLTTTTLPWANRTTTTARQPATTTTAPTTTTAATTPPVAPPPTSATTTVPAVPTTTATTAPPTTTTTAPPTTTTTGPTTTTTGPTTTTTVGQPASGPSPDPAP